MVQVYVFPNYLNIGNNSYPLGYNYWGYASTPNGIVYGIISAQSTFISFAEFTFIPSTYTYNGSTYYTYNVGVKQSNTLLNYPGQSNVQIYDNVVYYGSGSYIYAYDLILGSTIGSVLSSIIPAVIDTRDGMIFSFTIYNSSPSSVIYYTSLQYPILNALASWSSVVTPYNFNNGINDYPAIVANGSLYISLYNNAAELVVNAKNPNEYTVVGLPSPSAAPSSQYNGSLYGIQMLSNGLNEVYVYNSALNVVASYFLPNFYEFSEYITAMTSDYALILKNSNGLVRMDIYNIVSGSAIALYNFNDSQNIVYSNKYGVYLLRLLPLTILVPDNPLAVDVYTSQYAYNQIYIIASVSIANTVPVSSYLVRFYYSSVPNYDYYIGGGYKSTVYGAVHLHDVLQYIGSSYTNSNGLASILFTLPNANQKLYYYVEVEQGV